MTTATRQPPSQTKHQATPRAPHHQRHAVQRRTPRLGFLGTGWIGRHRMQAIAAANAGTVCGICDPSTDAMTETVAAAPGATVSDSFDALLELDLDGVVIATPSGMHAEQTIAALERGLAVFCQKPLARTATETRRVLDAARANDRLLGVDFSYRHTLGMRAISDAIRAGTLGGVYAVDLTFHNAYGPDKPWFFDPTLSGGGCVIDLGIHLVDLALWTLGFPRVTDVGSHLYAQGKRIHDPARQVEDYATSTLRLDNGTSVRLTCSWNLPAGQDAVIEAAFYGTRGGAALRNVNGSFYDFVAERFSGTRRETLAAPPDDWGGRAAVAWAEQLAADKGFDPESERLFEVASALDAVYGRAPRGVEPPAASERRR